MKSQLLYMERVPFKFCWTLFKQDGFSSTLTLICVDKRSTFSIYAGDGNVLKIAKNTVSDLVLVRSQKGTVVTPYQQAPYFTVYNAHPWIFVCVIHRIIIPMVHNHYAHVQCTSLFFPQKLGGGSAHYIQQNMVINSKTSNGCLKPQILLNPIYAMCFPTHTYTLQFLFGMLELSASLLLHFGDIIK